MMGRMIAGALAGVVATAAMSAQMLGGSSPRRIGTPPPRLIARKVLGTASPVAATVVHLTIGVSAGTGYSLMVRHRNPLSGALWGLVVWAVGYELVVPALSVLPPADRDRPGRVVALIQAHLVYGSVLGLLMPGNR